MKNLATLIFILFAQFFYGQWLQQSYTAAGTSNDIFCITENLVFAVGNNGVILKTTDGGVNWVQKTSGTTVDVIKVQFANFNVGYVLLKNKTMLKTIDGGESWILILTNNILDFSVVNPTIIYVTNTNFELLKSVDGCTNFATINTGNPRNNIQFINENIGFGGSNPLERTTNGGLTWTSVGNCNSTAQDFGFAKDVFHFVNENLGYKVMGNGVYKTVNGGISYTLLTLISHKVGKILGISENVVWLITVDTVLNGQPNYTTKIETIGSTVNRSDIAFPFFRAISFANSTLGYASYGNTIYKNSTGTMLSSKDILSSEKFKIFPNPAINQINISLSQKPFETFEVEIIDSFGKKIFSEVYQPIQDIKINTSSFSKGMYFLSILNKETRKTRKVIIQ